VLKISYVPETKISLEPMYIGKKLRRGFVAVHFHSVSCN